VRVWRSAIISRYAGGGWVWLGFCGLRCVSGAPEPETRTAVSVGLKRDDGVYTHIGWGQLFRRVRNFHVGSNFVTILRESRACRVDRTRITPPLTAFCFPFRGMWDDEMFARQRNGVEIFRQKTSPFRTNGPLTYG
jgi:hypothetical protein